MRIETIWKHADSLEGCLSHLRTETSHRLHSSDDDPLTIKNVFVSDEAKLLMSKAFRVLSHKTQVFTYPQSALIRNRATHVMEVVGISDIAAEKLGLNTNLVRAAALGHDIGHVPFGHQGEAWIAKAMGRPFCHEIMGVIVAQKIERKGQGLNLTWHTLDAMMRHSGNTAKEGMSQEAWTLRFTDKMAYLFADTNDIIVRTRFPIRKELETLLNAFGNNQRKRTSTAISGLVIESAEMGRVSFEHSDLGQKFKRLRELMYEIYPRVSQQNVAATLEPVFEFLQGLKLGDPFLILALMNDKDVECIAGKRMKDAHAFSQTAVSEIVPYLEQISTIDLCDPDLNW